ncbi:MAG: PorT family protein [Coprobacter sp.]|nr:PorT family protein [Coprobacter sp.]
MKRIIVLCTLIGLFGGTVSARTEISFGPKFGLNVTNCTRSHMNARTGVQLGALSNIRFNDYIALQPEILLSMQGCRKNDVVCKYNYFHIPVMAKAYLYKGLNLGFGPQFGLLADPRIRDKKAKTTRHPDNMNPFDFSLGFGVGYETGIGFLVDTRYNISTTKLTGSSRSRNSVLALTIGWKF